MGNHGSRQLLARAALGVSTCALAVALAGCPTVDLGDTPTDIGLCNPPGGVEYFEAEIWPRFIRPTAMTGCTRTGGCHAAGGNALDFNVTMPIDFRANYRQAQVFLNCGTPRQSELLTKPLAGENAHGGADIFMAESDDAVQAFLGWFE